MKNTEPTIKHELPTVSGWAFRYIDTGVASEELKKELQKVGNVPLYMKAVDGIDETAKLRLVTDLSTAYVVRDNGDEMLRIILQSYANAQGFELVNVHSV